MNKNVIIHTESDDNCLCHWKYIERYKKNGHWVYVYNDPKVKELQKKKKGQLKGYRIQRDFADSAYLTDREIMKKLGEDRYNATRRSDAKSGGPLDYPAKAYLDSATDYTNKIKERKETKEYRLGESLAKRLTTNSEMIAKGKEYLKKLVK